MARQHEKRYANDYFNEVLPGQHWQPRVWLGPLPPGKEANIYAVTTYWADAIVFDPKRITIIEFKLKPDPKAIGQLDLYEKLFRQTLRFQQYWKLPIYKKFVTTKIKDALQELSEDHSIEYEVFRPKWIDGWEATSLRL